MKFLSYCLMILMLGGCATQKFEFSDRDGRLANEEMQLFFLSGIGQTQTSASSACGGTNNIARLEFEQKFVDVALAILTIGIFTPRHARIYCK